MATAGAAGYLALKEGLEAYRQAHPRESGGGANRGLGLGVGAGDDLGLEEGTANAAINKFASYRESVSLALSGTIASLLAGSGAHFSGFPLARNLLIARSR